MPFLIANPLSNALAAEVYAAGDEAIQVRDLSMLRADDESVIRIPAVPIAR